MAMNSLIYNLKTTGAGKKEKETISRVRLLPDPPHPELPAILFISTHNPCSSNLETITAVITAALGSVQPQ